VLWLCNSAGGAEEASPKDFFDELVSCGKALCTLTAILAQHGDRSL